MDFAKVAQQVAEGFISRQKHPTADLWIYNYTPRAQYDRVWTDETLACRGLIADAAGRIVARPFKKFFNLEEHEGTLPSELFEVTEKLDGSLGIVYRTNGTTAIATRGSFVSPQSARANAILAERYPHVRFDPSLTYLLEIIYPQNRIVVDYGSKSDLYLLAVIETDTGKELARPDIGLPIVPVIEGEIGDFATLKALTDDNREGFVVRFAGGLRIKIKLAEYVRLHRILTGINARHIWEYLSKDRPLDEILSRVPDEFYAWVASTRDDLRTKFTEIQRRVRDVFDATPTEWTRKEKALKWTGEHRDICGILFSMLDGKDHSESIWKMLYPEASRPFRCDEP